MSNVMYNTFPPYVLKVRVHSQLVEMTKSNNNRSIKEKQMKNLHRREIKYKISDLIRMSRRCTTRIKILYTINKQH